MRHRVHARIICSTFSVRLSQNSITPTFPKLPRLGKFRGSRHSGIWTLRNCAVNYTISYTIARMAFASCVFKQFPTRLSASYGEELNLRCRHIHYSFCVFNFQAITRLFQRTLKYGVETVESLSLFFLIFFFAASLFCSVCAARLACEISHVANRHKQCESNKSPEVFWHFF